PVSVASYGSHHYLPPSPTRRSSDLPVIEVGLEVPEWNVERAAVDVERCLQRRDGEPVEREEHDERPREQQHVRDDHRGQRDRARSEEHTSELQSRVEIVCRLLLARR